MTCVTKAGIKKLVKPNNAHVSCIVNQAVKVQCDISYVSVVLSHCRVLTDRTKTELFSILIYQWANTEEDLGGPKITHMSNNTPSITLTLASCPTSLT